MLLPILEHFLVFFLLDFVEDLAALYGSQNYEGHDGFRRFELELVLVHQAVDWVLEPLVQYFGSRFLLHFEIRVELFMQPLQWFHQLGGDAKCWEVVDLESVVTELQLVKRVDLVELDFLRSRI